MADEDLEERLASLEAAVEDLRTHLPDGPAPAAAAAAAAAAEGDPLWVLQEIEARAPQGAVVYAGSVRTPTEKVIRWQYGESAPDVFDREWSEAAGALAALGSSLRLRILQAVLRGTTSAGALVDELDAGTSGQIYHHLKELTAAGWLASPRRGAFDIPPARVVPLLTILVAAGTPTA